MFLYRYVRVYEYVNLYVHIVLCIYKYIFWFSFEIVVKSFVGVPGKGLPC